MARARRRARHLVAFIAAGLTAVVVLGTNVPGARAGALAQTCQQLYADPAVAESICRRADEIGRQAGELLRAWPSTYPYFRPTPPYPGGTLQRPYPWELLGSPFVPELPLRELYFMGIDPAPQGSDYSRLIRYYMTPLVFVPNFGEAMPYLYGGQGPRVVTAWADYLGKTVDDLRPDQLVGDGARETIARWLREGGYLIGDVTAGPRLAQQQVTPRPPPAPPAIDAAEEARRYAWWVAHNSCTVALGRAMLFAQAQIPADAYGIGIDRTNDPGQGVQDNLITVSGILVLGNVGFASGNETMYNWNNFDSLLRDLQTQLPPLSAAPIFLRYSAALAAMRVAGAAVAEGRMDVSPTVGPATAEFARQLNVLEGLWPDRPRVDLADCERWWPNY